MKEPFPRRGSLPNGLARDPEPEPGPSESAGRGGRSGLDRFRSLEAEGGVPLAERGAPVALAPGVDLPFRRCARCGMDAHRSARVCEMCGADLRTPEQEHFNRALHEERRAADAALAREAAELSRRQAAAAGEQRRMVPASLGSIPRAGDPDLLPDLLAPGGLQRLTGRLVLDLLLRGIRAVPAVVWIGFAALLLGSVAYSKARGGFGGGQLLVAGALLVPTVIGILTGRPLQARRRIDRSRGAAAPPTRNSPEGR